jgi:hypothetical protein
VVGLNSPKGYQSGLPILLLIIYIMSNIFGLSNDRKSDYSGGVPPRRSYRYIKTIPLPWIVEASKLSQSAIRVGLLLWYRYGLTNDPRVRLSSKRLAEFDIPRRTCTRGLVRLEGAGLVVVHRQHGRAPVARIVLR